MLFDLRGKRRRAVQVTYLALALLMGGGLLLFGIGGGVSGGIVDAITGSGGGGGGNSQLKQQIKQNEKLVVAHPNDTAALKALVQDHYANAVSNQPSGSTSFSDSAKADLRAADRYWQRYLAVEKGTPDASLARVAVQLYQPGALNQPKAAAKAVAVVAEAQNDYTSYLLLVQAAAKAGDSRTADLAAQKAVDLAPKSLKKQVQKAAKQAKNPAATPTPSGQ
jgi:hypothetical protein